MDGKLAGLWVCGTDTGVGKTVVTGGLVRALDGLGCRVVALKPVVSGGVQLPGRPVPAWEDLERLGLAGGLRVEAEQRSVYRLMLPAAPAFAASSEGVAIDREHLLTETRRQAAVAEFAVVEGVGGVRVPLDGGYDTSHFASDLACPAVLVVGMRLGCISHALLSAEVLAARGIPLAAWVANAGMDCRYPHVEETIATLERAFAMDCAARLGPLGGGAALDGTVDFGAWQGQVDRQITGAGETLAALAKRIWTWLLPD